MGEITRSIASIATAIVGLAILAVLVSKNANTAQIIGQTGTSFSSAIANAVAPVTQSGHI